MEPDRQEVYERIPWETLEKKSGDRRWLVYAIAAAVTVAALAYSFTRNQPVEIASQAQPVPTSAPAVTVEDTASSPSTLTSPVVVAEADLYAVDPERLLDQAVSHAEWFAVEYISFDGSEESAEVLASLLPPDVPLPDAPEGTQVFVDWVGAQTVNQTGPLRFDVQVLVRSLASAGDAGFVRQSPRLALVPVEFDDGGRPRLSGLPSVEQALASSPGVSSLQPLPGELETQIASQYGEVLGGNQMPDGSWQVAVMATGADGVRRPVTIYP